MKMNFVMCIVNIVLVIHDHEEVNWVYNLRRTIPT